MFSQLAQPLMILQLRVFLILSPLFELAQGAFIPFCSYLFVHTFLG